MKILRKTKALNADLDSLIEARSFLDKLIDINNDAQLYKDYEKNLAQSIKQLCGDTIEVNGHKDKEPWFGNDQPLDAQTVVQTIRCIKSGNHSGNHKSYNPFRLGEKFLEWPNTEDKQVRLDFCNKQYVSTVDNDTYYCLLQPNHDGKCGYSVPEIHQRVKDQTNAIENLTDLENASSLKLTPVETSKGFISIPICNKPFTDPNVNILSCLDEPGHQGECGNYNAYQLMCSFESRLKRIGLKEKG